MSPNVFFCARAVARRFLRREDGRTAVEYAIVVNLIVLLAILGINVSGYNGRRTITKVCDHVGTAYQTTQGAIYGLFHKHRGEPMANNAGAP
jgi:Flp pilus assembly pilin Flp